MYNVIPTPRFEDDIRFYMKRKKYKKIKDDIEPILEDLENGILVGDEISDLHFENEEGVFKVRAANTSANLGKSNGFRVIYYVIKNDQEIYLLTIYSKKDVGTIGNSEIVKLVKAFCM